MEWNDPPGRSRKSGKQTHTFKGEGSIFIANLLSTDKMCVLWIIKSARPRKHATDDSLNENKLAAEICEIHGQMLCNV